MYMTEGEELKNLSEICLFSTLFITVKEKAKMGHLYLPTFINMNIL